MRRLLRKRLRGFTLLETLVALGIAALALNGFYSALSTGSLLTDRADEQAEKVFAATTILDRVGVDIPLRPGTTATGTILGYSYELIIGSGPPPDMNIGFTRQGELMFVYVSVRELGSTGDPVTLRAVRYGETPI